MVAFGASLLVPAPESPAPLQSRVAGAVLQRAGFFLRTPSHCNRPSAAGMLSTRALDPACTPIGARGPTVRLGGGDNEVSVPRPDRSHRRQKRTRTTGTWTQTASVAPPFTESIWQPPPGSVERADCRAGRTTETEEALIHFYDEYGWKRCTRFRAAQRVPSPGARASGAARGRVPGRHRGRPARRGWRPVADERPDRAGAIVITRDLLSRAPEDSPTRRTASRPTATRAWMWSPQRRLAAA